MENIKFESGVKQYSINGDENAVISIRTNDYAILDRIKKALKNTEQISQEYKGKQVNSDDDANEIFVSADKKIREQINYIFNADVCSKAFGQANCLSPCDDGNVLFENFLNAIVPLIRSNISAAQKEQNKRIEKYTSQAKELKK